MAANPLPTPSEAPRGCLSLVPLQKSRGEAPAASVGHFTDRLGRVFTLVLDAVSSPETKRQYARSLADFTVWLNETREPLTRASVYAWRADLEARGLAASTVNVRLAAVRKLAKEAAANGFLDAETAAGIDQVEGVKQRGSSVGSWLSRAQAQNLIEAPTPNTLKGKRDRVALALLVGCGLRREEAATLTFEHIQQREGRWVIIDMRGKHGRIRSIPVPNWVKAAVDSWALAISPLCGEDAGKGRILRGMNKGDRITHDTLSGRAVFDLASQYGAEIGVELKAHDLRRTCAKLCRKAGGELEQIQLLLGHASIQTTERYLGTKQDLTNAPNDRMGLKWRDE